MSTLKLADAPPHLQERYGYRKVAKSTIAVGVLLLLVVVALGIWIGSIVANPDVRWTLLGYSDKDAAHTTVTYEVTRDADTAVQCALRVQDARKSDVGYAIVTIPAGTATFQQTYPVATTARGASGQILGCAQVGKQLPVPPPDFPPGMTNPSQPWSPS